MDDEPGKSVLKKKESSLIKAIQFVADGHAKAVVSAGNSGAALVAGTLLLGRAPDILRPAIGGFFPTNKGSIFCIDLGASTDCKPEFLRQFAFMGHAYVKVLKGIVDPRIALLSNGAESCKGSSAVKSAHKLLAQSGLNFIGNLEARDIFDDRADVLVCDGFAGNVMLKAIQGAVKAVLALFRKEAESSWWSALRIKIASGVFKSVKKQFDSTARGGALLCGINHPFIIAHGNSNEVAIEHALLFAQEIVEGNTVSLINAEYSFLVKRYRDLNGPHLSPSHTASVQKSFDTFK
jgi:glycerol-3-phosphate acyltransferase PlsX